MLNYLKIIKGYLRKEIVRKKLIISTSVAVIIALLFWSIIILELRSNLKKRQEITPPQSQSNQGQVLGTGGVNFKTYKGLNFPWGINNKGVSTFNEWLSSKYDEQVTSKSFEEIKGMGVETVGMWLWFDRMLVKDANWGTDAYVTKFDPTFKANWESFLKNVVKAKDMEVVVTMFTPISVMDRDPYKFENSALAPVFTGSDILGQGVANGDMAIDESPKDGLPDGWTVNTGSAQNSYLYEPGDGTTGSPARDLKLTSNSSSQIGVISPKVPYPYQGALLALSATYKGNLISFKTFYYDINDKYLGDDFFSPNLGMTNNTANWTTVTWPSRTVKIPPGTAKIAINATAGDSGTTSIGPVRIALGARNAKWRNYMQAVKDWVSMYGSSTEYRPAVAAWQGIKEVSDGWHFFVTRDFSRDFYQTIKSTGTTQPVGIDNSPYFRLAVTDPNNQPWFNDAADYYSLHIYDDNASIPDTSKLDKPFILGEFGAENNCPNGGSPEKGDCKGSDTNLANPNADWNLNAVSKFYPNGKIAGAKTALGWAWVSNATIAQHKMDGTNVLGNAGQWIKDWNPDGGSGSTASPTPTPTSGSIPTPTPSPSSSNNPAAGNSPTPTTTGSGSPAPAGGLPGSSPVGTTPPADAGLITVSETVTPIPDQALEPANNASGSDNSGWFQPISAQEIQNLISSLTTSESTSSAATSQDLGKTLAVVGAITAVAILMGIFTFVVIP